MFATRKNATRATTTRSLVGSRRGSSAVEYALLLGLLGSLLLGGVSFAGVTVSNSIEDVSSSLVLDAADGEASGNDNNRSGLGDGTNPGQGSGTGNSPNEGTDNPNNAGSGGPQGSGSGNGHF